MTIKSSPNWLLTSVERSYNAYLALETSDSLDRSLGIKAMAKGLNRSFDAILEANTLDLEMSREMAIPDILIDYDKSRMSCRSVIDVKNIFKVSTYNINFKFIQSNKNNLHSA